MFIFCNRYLVNYVQTNAKKIFLHARSIYFSVPKNKHIFMVFIKYSYKRFSQVIHNNKLSSKLISKYLLKNKLLIKYKVILSKVK